MDWLDTLLERGNEAKRAHAEPAAAPERVILTVWIQTREPRNGDLGGTEAGHYFVADGVLTMCSEDGKPTGKTHRLEPGEDPKVIAGRLRRAAWLAERGESDFNRPLDYARFGVA
jgi:hypothetical protein